MEKGGGVRLVRRIAYVNSVGLSNGIFELCLKCLNKPMWGPEKWAPRPLSLVPCVGAEARGGTGYKNPLGFCIPGGASAKKKTQHGHRKSYRGLARHQGQHLGMNSVLIQIQGL